MKHKIFLAAALAAYLLAGRDLRAAPYANGDLLLGFVAESSPGDTTTLVVRLGSAASFRDATTNNVNLLNIGSQLASTFGATWYDRIDLYMSVFASTDSSSLSTTLTNGQDRLVEHVADHLGLMQQLSFGVAGDVAERVHAEFVGLGHDGSRRGIPGL